MGKAKINSLIVDGVPDTELAEVAQQVSAIFTDHEQTGGWMLIETEDAHNAVWVSPASDVRLEFDGEPPPLD